MAAATTELGSSIAEISRQASHADRLAGEARQQTAQGLQAAQRLTTTAAEIGEVAKAIESIAAKTNLLALNATIEAAAAGEYGRGFAIVAGEVKALAGQAKDATSAIAKRLSAVQMDAAAVDAAMRTLATATGALAQATTSIAAAVEEQTAVTNELSSNSSNLADSARAAGGSAAAVGGVAGQITSVDASLQQAAAVFRCVG